MSRLEEKMFAAPAFYWVGKRRCLHRVVSRLCDMEQGGVSPEAFWNDVAKLCAKHGLFPREDDEPVKDNHWIPTQRAFRRHVDLQPRQDAGLNEKEGFTLHGDHRYRNAFAIVALWHIDNRAGSTGIAEEDIKVLLRFREDAREPDAPTRVSGKKVPAKAAKDTGELFARLFPLLGLQPAFLESAAHRLFGPKLGSRDSPARRYYETYRFSTRPGFVDKSFTVISVVGGETPLVEFKNFFGEDPDVRRSTGLAFGLAKGVYLMGVNETEEAAKIVVLTTANYTRQPIRGGVMSTDADGNVIAAKLLMMETAVADSRGFKERGRLEIGPRELAAVQAEIGADEVEALRNRIPFTLEDTILQLSGDEYGPCNQADMVTRTAYTLMPNGKPIFKVEWSGVQFNPASSAHYTFNAALKIG